MLEKYQNVTVTGGLGFIGTHLVGELQSLGKSVTIIDNLWTSADKPVPKGVRFIEVDIRDPRKIAESIEGADLVFHVAANSNGTFSVEDPRLDHEVNDIGTFNVIEGASNGGVGRVLYVSSASVYGMPRSFRMHETDPKEPFVPYGSSKYRGELNALSFHHARGLDVVIARPFCVYGPGENPKIALVEPTRFIRWALNDDAIPVVGDPDRKIRDFVSVHDLARGLLVIADKGQAGQAYNVGSGEEISMTQLVRTIGQITERKVRIHAIPEITDDTYRLVADISKIRSLGYNPQISLREGLKEIVRSLGDHPERPSGGTIFRVGQKAESRKFFPPTPMTEVP
jgi:UDP-glucose 4-epimerase